jgi:signal transduction histidine kinase
MLAAYAAGTRRKGEALRVGVAGAALAVLMTEFAAWREMPLQSALLAAGALCVVVLGAPLAIAFVVVTHRRMVDALRAEKDALEQVQGALLDAAIARERAGIARELHDIAAHHMSGITLMCAAVERQLDTDYDAAKDGLKQIREQSRLVLGDLRQAVGLLRGDTEDGIETRRIEAVEALAASHAAAGPPVTFHLRARQGDEPVGGGLGPLAHLAGYRMVQESLANAARHAPGAATEVTIDDSAPASLTIKVTNGPAPHRVAQDQPGGFGLTGMLERAQLVHGKLQYGATPEGGWQVSLQLPRLQSTTTGESP